MLRESDLGWFAGVLDMKGRVIVKRNKTRKLPQITLMVETKELDVARAMSEMTGTKMELATRTNEKAIWNKRACSEHCPDAHVHVPGSMPLMSRWTASGAAAATILFNVMPFLRNKKEYEDLFEELVKNTVLVGQGSAATISALYRLSEKGWVLPPQYELAFV